MRWDEIIGTVATKDYKKEDELIKKRNFRHRSKLHYFCQRYKTKNTIISV